MNWLTTPAPVLAVSTATLLVRVVVGAAFVLHGWPKIQNPTGWMGGGTDTPPGFMQAAAAGLEVCGGVLLALGLLTRVAAVGLAGVMVGALVLYHAPQNTPFVSTGGPSWELTAVYLTVMLLMAATGPGAWSLDAALFRRRR